MDPDLNPVSAAVAGPGLDHARLAYTYLNNADMDGYASLFDPAAVVRRPGARPLRGHAALEGARVPGSYLLKQVFAAADRVAATGTLLRAGLDAPVEFADIFTVGASGLLLAQSTYYFVPPAPGVTSTG